MIFRADLWFALTLWMGGYLTLIPAISGGRARDVLTQQ